MKPHKEIKCQTCDGHGVVEAGYHNPKECKDCYGSGKNVRYSNGSIAKFYGGPMVSGASK